MDIYIYSPLISDKLESLISSLPFHSENKQTKNDKCTHSKKKNQKTNRSKPVIYSQSTQLISRRFHFISKQYNIRESMPNEVHGNALYGWLYNQNALYLKEVKKWLRRLSKQKNKKRKQTKKTTRNSKSEEIVTCTKLKIKQWGFDGFSA